eukprot:jgi/Tetstr1/455112/TSEL_041964.t1
MAVPAPPMSRATSSQHPATTASATADGAVAGGGDALPCDDDAPDAPRQEAEEAVVEATDGAEDVFHDATRAAVCEASEKARAAGRVRRVRRRTAREMMESETCRQ